MAYGSKKKTVFVRITVPYDINDEIRDIVLEHNRLFPDKHKLSISGVLRMIIEENFESFKEWYMEQKKQKFGEMLEGIDEAATGEVVRPPGFAPIKGAKQAEEA